MTLTKQKNGPLTEGPILARVVLFSLPLIAANLLQVLYNSADMIVVGLSSEPDAVGAIGATSALIHLIVNIFIGFSTGANVMVARHIGAGQNERVSRTVHTAILMSVLFGVLCGVLGIFVSHPILVLMGAEARVLDLADLYTKIYFAGVPFISLTNYTISILRAKGDTKTPLYILSLSGLLNVVLNLGFVLIFDMSVEGVALATVLSNVVSAILLLLRLAREEGACRFSLKKLVFDKTAFGEILYVGLPAGIQSALFSVSNLIIQSSILQVNNAMCPPDSAYQPVVKGNSAASNLENFAFTACNAIHQAAVTFTGQNAGAKKYDRVSRVFGACTLTTLLLSSLLTALIFLLRDPLFALYGVVDGAAGTLDHMAYDTAYQRLVIHLFPFPIYAFMDTCNGIARGLKKAISATVITLIGTCALRVVWIATIFRAEGTLASIFWSYPISWVVTGVAQLTLVLLVLHNRKKTAKAELV